MQERVLKILEFNKVKEQLLEHVSSSLGRKKALKILPSTDYEEVIRRQEETDEAVTVLRIKGNVPLGGIFDIRPHVKRAVIGGMLSPQELNQISSTIHASRQMKRFIEEFAEEESSLPILLGYTDKIIVLADLETSIRNAVDDNGEVLDSASETLRSLRNQLRTKESRVRERLESMIRSSSAQKMLSDAIITIRNDRFVIPVKQEYRGHYGGIIHDQSSSGQTLFIEPASIVQLNNELQGIRVKEQQEIERILIALSGQTAKNSSELDTIVDVLGEVDFTFAKARYSKRIKASKPKINNQGKISLFKARHPLIPIDEVVANDIKLGDEYSTIVITGPNTGGKTVTLKTVGLCTLMAQAGLQIPALDGSETAVFGNVYADIGDEQSIEQSLSTFSSHMVNIVDILNQVDFNSLVLFDELGAGTDPQEGAALAISILDEVYKRGARVIATTHYPELKAYGYNREGVINASVEFDIETLSPTYKLLIGVPGRSNAFEISKRLGLNDQVIETARSYIGTDTNQVENMIASLEESRRQAEADMAEANDFLKSAEKLHKDLQKQMAEFYEQKDAMYEKAAEKAGDIVEKAKAEAEEIIRDLRKMRMEKHAEVKEHELIEAKKRLSDAAPQMSTAKNKLKPKNTKHAFEAGDEVKVLSFGQKGHLLEKVSENEWQVQIGILKMKVAEKDLEYIKSPKPVETKPVATVKGRDFHVSLELDLRGERYENALLRVEKYIDDALLAGYPRVSIIHGKGTGALRQGVQEYLRNHRSVKKIRFGEAGEGGTGVTIVEFK
ncbi:endonuclease MutS2 [Cytobacillus firmus]|uniref:endonuclease MutS2 n=1 Tax=Cytobacillus firmus TaxID=1399 RepID=UPI00077CA789|nr:endonuclease MutS2 [Cytobacillus firmus]MBG9545409.1 recombination and DNA strand exchange inhibitor protein [Cytobacillus firmus]MBG9552733.1 recombination and DNA strand exchange inhibitor protein [Cytobacillus firmus]MBG9558946.1 recombination and DNA strand exchange inhibitor protein [Cytobacillus firmus]MBG9576868.1 recombination and DNA strand exchange inhibitor protein [Cytobacillus firmus]MEC1892607.1 endonuclease MutS2 [Cytobacillus firmus]